MEKVAGKLQVLFSDVYVPAFLNKLASRGVRVQTEDDLEGALKIAAYTKILNAQVAENTANQSVIKEAAINLEKLLAGQSTSEVSEKISELDKILKS